MDQTTSTVSKATYRWGFSSLGCGELTVEEMCALAVRFDIHDLELRSIADRLDLPAYLAETYADAADLKALLARHGQRVIQLDSSFKLIGSGPDDRAELLSFVTWAEALNVPFIRAFGGGSMDQPLSSAQLQEAAGQYAWWEEQKVAGGWQVDLLLETHDGFCSSDRCLALHAAMPGSLGIIWDTHHTWKVGGEPVEQTWDRMGHLVKHVHIKDSVSIPSARHPYTYVTPGEGEFPAPATLKLLTRVGFGGVICLEWERKWHPYLKPLDHALAALASAGWRE
jgi:sugar phosphate isomerase/epimerase